MADTILDSIVRNPIVDSEEYDGTVNYESPRLKNSYSGRITATLKGVLGEYIAYDRSLDSTMDSYVQKDEDRGNLVPDDQQATITGTDATAAYTARRASDVHATYQTPGDNSVRLQFNAFSLDVTYSEESISLWRFVFADAEIPIHRTFQGQFRGRTTVVAQAATTKDRDFVVAVHDGEQLDELEERALWFAVNFLCGTKAGNYILEGYDKTGRIVSRQFRAGHEPLPVVIALFNRRVMPPRDFVDVFPNGFYDAVGDGFPIDVILEQLFDSANSVLDFTLQNCLLAVHAAFEAWHKIKAPDVIADKTWLADNKALLCTAIDGLLKSAPGRVRNNLTYGINAAANFGTGDKERRFFADWSIDISGADERKALALRNGLLHDGYFNRRFGDIAPNEQQFRVNAIGTLKNLIALILFRVVGYSGSFISQRDFFTQLTAVSKQAIFPLI